MEVKKDKKELGSWRVFGKDLLENENLSGILEPFGSKEYQEKMVVSIKRKLNPGGEYKAYGLNLILKKLSDEKTNEILTGLRDKFDKNAKSWVDEENPEWQNIRFDLPEELHEDLEKVFLKKKWKDL